MTSSTTLRLAVPALQARFERLATSHRRALADRAVRLMLERGLFNMITPTVVIAAYLALRGDDHVMVYLGAAALAGMAALAVVRVVMRSARGTSETELRRRRRDFVVTEVAVNALWLVVVCAAISRRGLGVSEAMLLLITAGLGSAMMYGLQPDLRLRLGLVLVDGAAVTVTLAALGTTESLTYAGLAVGLLGLQIVQSRRVYAQYWIGVLDGAERERSTDAVRASQAELRRVIDAAPVGMLAVRDGRVVLANPEMRRLLAGSQDGLLDAPLAAIAPELITATSPAGERRLASGALVEVHTPTEIALDGAPATLLVMRDIGPRRELESRLAVADRAVGLATMAAGFAHELNNPLVVVEGNLELARQALRAAPPDLATAGVVLDEASASCVRLRSLVAELGALSRTDERPSPIALRPIVASAVRLAQTQVRHRAAIRVELEEVPRVMAIPSELVQVVLALLTNAAQAMPDGRADEHTVTVRLVRDGEAAVAIEIADDGEGIAPEVLARVFEPFFTTRGHAGTGLGLTIAHAIVRRAGGELTVRSRRDAGTVARVVLPALPGEPAAPQPATRARVPVVGARRVLVVDDEPLIGALIRRMLKSDDVTVVESAAAAVEHLAAHTCDVVVCDLMMPEVTGIELHARLATERPDITSRMIFMSGGVFTGEAHRFVDSLGDRMLTKPFGRVQLETAIDAVLGATP